MQTDQELLQCYVQERSEKAFTELVQRHVDLVYGAALRQLCGNVSLAEDVTQSVFTTLAANAVALSKKRHLPAWIYTTTRFTVSHTVRTERRRQTREQKAHAMEDVLAQSDTHEGLEVPPKLIDEVLERLDETDREAVLLRFFEGQSFAAIGTAMGVSEDAGRMRVTRALEKIRAIFAQNGITSSVSAVGLALANQAIAAPANLAAKAAVTALAGATTATAKIGLIALMTTSKGTAWIATSVAILALGYSVYEYREVQIRRDESRWLTQERDSLKEALKQSEQRSVEGRRRVELAERQIEELRQKQESSLAAKAPRAAEIIPTRANEKRTSDAIRMAEMKPLLEGGMPISGAIIVMADGNPVQKPVAFVIGKETRIAGIDDGVYLITPALNQDGSVKYGITLSTTEAASGVTRVISFPAIVQKPWSGFTLSVNGDGKVIAFDPDKGSP
jgi:RNA polymerase sigma factor (sigma-70 family)